MMSLYFIGMFLAVIISRLFSKTLFKGEDTPFVMELPPYRFPTAKALGRHTWEKGKMYLKKMGGIILVASIIVWALSYFPIRRAWTSRSNSSRATSLPWVRRWNPSSVRRDSRGNSMWD